MTEHPFERTAYESDAINCGKIKIDVLDLILRISRVKKMVNDHAAQTNLEDLHAGLMAALHDSMNAGMDGISTILADFDADDDAQY